MSRELQYPGEYEIDFLQIQSSTGDSVDLRKSAVEINLFENIFSNALSGSIIFVYTNDIVTNFPITGQEFVNMKIRFPSDEDISIDMVFWLSGPLLIFVEFNFAKFLSDKISL